MTVILTVLSVFLMVGVNSAQTQNCTPAPVGLVNWYPANGNANDVRGGENGTLTNSAGYAPGKVDQAFNFTNSSGQLTAPAAANLPTFTIDFWVYLNSYGGNNPTLFERGSSGNRIGFIVQGNGQLWFLVRNSVYDAGAASLIPLNQWTHVALTQGSNGSQTEFKVYVNGSLAYTTNEQTIGQFAPYNAGTLAVGGSQAFVNQNLVNGLFDETHVFNRALKASEIQAIYNAGSGGVCANPPANSASCQTTPVGMNFWAPLDETSGSIVKDIRGAGAGTITGATPTSGKVAGAYNFNGASKIDFPNAPAYNPQYITAEAWVATTLGGLQTVIGKFDHGSGNYSYMLGIQDGLVRFQINTTGGTPIMFSNGTTVADGNFHHIVGTYDGALMRIYIDGTLAAQNNASGTLTPSPIPLSIGANGATSDPTNRYYFNGKIDEASIYNRALSPAEITALYYAGSAGKCKPTAVLAPSGQVGWFAGDGDARDLSGSGNNGTFVNGANVSGDYRVGKVGQAFNFSNTNARVEAPTNNFPIGGSPRTMEMWVKIDSYNAFEDFFAGYGAFGSLTQAYSLGANQSHNLQFSQWGATVLGPVLNLNTWYHVAVSNNGDNVTLYLNGAPVAASSLSINTAAGTTFYVGQQGTDTTRSLKGKVDEVSVYNRELTATEISAIYNAGLAGKLKTAPTGLPPLSIFTKKSARKETFASFGTIGTTVQVGDATITFPSLITSGVTQEIPLNLALFPALPAGISTSLTYDIATSAVYSGSPTVCFNLPSFTTAQFPNLRIYHLEGGAWVNRTNSSSSYPNLCTSGLTSLSPFAIASLAPTAANVSVSGKVFDTGGAAISRAIVSLTDSHGVTRTVKTNSFGNYSFDAVAVGESYLVSVSAKGYQFTPQVISVSDNITDLNFTPQ